MGLFLRLSNGFPRSFTEASSVPIYDQRLTVVASGASGSNQVNGPVVTGTSVTLPQSGTYSGLELQIYLNGDRLEDVADYTYVGSGGSKTQVQFTFNLVVGDTVDFVTQRGP